MWGADNEVWMPIVKRVGKPLGFPRVAKLQRFETLTNSQTINYFWKLRHGMLEVSKAPPLPTLQIMSCKFGGDVPPPPPSPTENSHWACRTNGSVKAAFIAATRMPSQVILSGQLDSSSRSSLAVHAQCQLLMFVRRKVRCVHFDSFAFRSKGESHSSIPGV